MWVCARAWSPRGELVLSTRPDDEAGTDVLELRVNGIHVMDTAETSSEHALAALALAASDMPGHVLVGGLGLGCTLRRVLADPRVLRASVVELEPALVEWLRTDVVPGGRVLLADPRVDVRVVDVRHQVESTPPESIDVLLLDVDNGPDYLVHAGNDVLYQPGFLGRCATALAGHGVLAVWSMSNSAALASALRSSFADVRTHRCPVRLQGHDTAYWVTVATGPRPLATGGTTPG